jgi:restriction system protein
MPTTFCSDCGASILDDSAESARREPCPDCGRPIETPTIRLKLAPGWSLVSPPTAGLLMQTVIVPGDRTSEGRLIEAVTTPWFEIISLLTADPNIAFQIPPHKWEEIIAGAYHKAGWDEVTLTPRSGDFGRDVIAVKYGLGMVRVIDQVKAYKPDNLVTANDVRALIGVLHGDQASKGFLTTTSDFAPRLHADPLILPFMPSRLELINGTTLLSRQSS